MGKDDGSSLFFTLYVHYCECYALPQLSFTGSVTDLPQLTQAFPRLHFVLAGDGGEGPSSTPLVSLTFSEEVESVVWSVHPCDTHHLIMCALLDGCEGSCTVAFLRALAPYFGLPSQLVP